MERGRYIRMKHTASKFVSLTLALLLVFTCSFSTIVLAEEPTELTPVDAYSIIKPLEPGTYELSGFSGSDGGASVGRVGSNGYAHYRVNFGEGKTVTGFAIEASVPPEYNSATMYVCLGMPQKESDGTITNAVATVTTKPTGAWDNFRPIYGAVTDNSQLTGIQDIYLVVNNYGNFGNFASFTFFEGNDKYAYGDTLAASKDSSSEGITVTQDCVQKNFTGGSIADADVLTDITNGSYAAYENMSFYTNDNTTGKVAPLYFAANLKSETSGGKIQVRLDSQEADPIAELTVEATSNYRYQYAPVTASDITGEHTLYLTFVNESGEAVCNGLQSFAFQYAERNAYNRFAAHYPDGKFGDIETAVLNGAKNEGKIGKTGPTVGTWYDAVNFGDDSANQVILNYSCPTNDTSLIGQDSGGKILIWVDSHVRDSLPDYEFPMYYTGSSWDDVSTTHTENLEEALSGVHSIMISYSQAGKGNFGDIQFVKAPSTENVIVDAKTIAIADETGGALYPELMEKHQTMQFSAEMQNLTGNAMNANIYMGLINQDNSIAALAKTTKAFTEADTEAQKVTASLTVDEAPVPGQTLRVFVWNDAMQPCLDTPYSMTCIPSRVFGEPIAATLNTSISGTAKLEGTRINSVSIGSVIQFRNVDFGTGCTRFGAHIGRSDVGDINERALEIWINGPAADKNGTNIGKLVIPATDNGFENLEWRYVELNEAGKALTDTQDIYLVATGGPGVGNFDTIVFDNQPVE